MADISYDKNRDRYQVRATIQGKRKYIGRYKDYAEAFDAYMSATKEDVLIQALQYEHQDKDIWWLDVFRDMKKRLFAKVTTLKQKREAQKKLDEYVDTQLNIL